jgi:hypothetical protein
MNNKWLVIFIFVSHFFAVNNLFAYKTNKTDDGKDVKCSSNSMSYLVNTAGWTSGSLSAIQAAMQTWSDVPTSVFAFVYGGATDRTDYGLLLVI